VRFHIARCQEKLGRWVEAVGTYRLALSEAETASVTDVVREAGSALAALEPLVPRLRLQRGAGTAGATIALDGVSLGATSIGAELSVDPGPHRVEAWLGARRAVFTVTLAARDHKALTVDLPGEAATAGRAPPAAAEPRPAAAASPSRAWAYGALGVGVVGLAAAGTFWALRIGTVNDLEARCVDGHCPPSLESTSDRGRAFTIAAGGSLAVSALGFGAFTWIMLRNRSTTTASPTSSSSSARAPSLALGVAPHGARLAGAF
jgi:hypothetical protein